jgi:hypothetical protein
MLLVFRCLAGALSGNVAVIKAAVGDLTDDTNSTEAFALFGLTWTVGAMIGWGLVFRETIIRLLTNSNALGGMLSHPYERFPSLFGYEIFRIHPYLLRECPGSLQGGAGTDNAQPVLWLAPPPC